ncbi:MAG: efflux RND transporter periplasmic adaptor subunit [Patescibacteria group bacterium]
MKKIFKRKSFWLIVVVILLLIVGGVYYQFKQGSSLIEYTTEKVKRGKLVQTVTATGQVESAEEINLNFQITGKLVYLKAKEGDTVKAGDVLASLDSGGAAALINQYRSNVSAAAADLAKVKAGSSPEDIKVTEEQFLKAEADLANLKSESTNQLLILREKNLDTLNNAVFTFTVALDKVYNYFINDKTTNGLQVTDTSLLNKVESDYYLLRKNLDSAREIINQANSVKSDDLILASSDQMRDSMIKLNYFLNDAFGLGDTIILNTYYSQTTKDTIKTDIGTQQSTNNTALTSLQTAKSNLINETNSYNSQIKAAENNLGIYQAQLNLKKAGPRNFEVESAEAKVAQAQAQLNKALSDFGNYTIKAPINGKITKVNFSVGEQTSLTEPVISMLGTEKYQIKVDIPESDITKVKIGDKVSIELDAFGSDHPFSGAISFVDPAQTVIKDVTYYKTTVSFDQDSWNDQIKPGMTANITIMTGEKDDVLFIPQRAVRVKEASLGETATKVVSVLANNQEEEKVVVVGLRGDNGLVEVLSGLTEGQEVITFKKDNGKK